MSNLFVWAMVPFAVIGFVAVLVYVLSYVLERINREDSE
jgi:hypothetical protein